MSFCVQLNRLPAVTHSNKLLLKILFLTIIIQCIVSNMWCMKVYHVHEMIQLYYTKTKVDKFDVQYETPSPTLILQLNKPSYTQVWLLATTLLDKLAPFEVLWDSTGPLGVPRDVLSLLPLPLPPLVLLGLARATACGVDSFEKVPLTWCSSWSRTACIPSISSSSWNTNSLSSIYRGMKG